MLWRAQGVTGWLESDACRQRLFREEEDRLYADVRCLQPQGDGLLGNDVASSHLQEWIPDVVMRLRSGAARPAGGLRKKLLESI